MKARQQYPNTRPARRSLLRFGLFAGVVISIILIARMITDRGHRAD